MKKILTFLALITFIMTANLAAKDWKTIRVATEGAYPPFNSITADGKLTGFDVDIGRAMCDYLKVKCVWQTVAWDGTIPGLLARKYDAFVGSMSITTDRMKKVAFSNKYYASPTRFAAHEDFFTRVVTGKQGKVRIGAQKESIQDRYITDKYGKTAEIVRYDLMDNMFLDMKSGRLDIGCADGIAFSYGFLKTPGNEKFQFVGPTVTDEKYLGVGVGVAIHKNNQDLVELFNKAIKGIRANGDYVKIQNKYFDIDVYGE
jgi:arginine/ornithine transport system substrate-binding protein